MPTRAFRELTRYPSHTRYQAATLASNKNASKAVRDKLKAQQAAAAICDAANQKSKQFTAKASGPNTL